MEDYLSSRTAEQLAGILRRRPDATWGAPITGLPDLAERLSSTDSLHRALQHVPEPCLQLLHGIVALGPSTTSAALRAFIRGPDEPAAHPPAAGADADTAVPGFLRRLEELAVVWPDGDRLVRDRALTELVPRPLRVGPTLPLCLGRLSRAELSAIAGACGLPTSGSAAALTDRLIDLLADRGRVSALLADAPAAVRSHLEQLAIAQARGDQMPARARAQLEGENWLRRRGLLFSGDYYPPEIPAEVVLAVLGPRVRMPFTPTPPEYLAHTVSADAIARGTAASAADATQSVASLIDRLSRTPAAGLKAGGVGSRELVKIGKALGIDQSRVRFDLEVLAELGVLDGVNGAVGVAPVAANWRAAEPAGRFADLVAIWWTLPVHPTIDRDEDGKTLPAASGAGRGGAGVSAGVSAEHLRGAVLSLIADLGPDRAVGDSSALAALLAWHRPFTRNDGRQIAAVWREAHDLGVLVDGALSPVGRCLLDGDVDELLSVATRLLPAATSAGRFGSDLTVLVPGSPSATVSALLDTCADREGRGAAVVWRFSPASVRRAFDEGRTAEELTADLRGLLDPAADSDLPQTLTYLIFDVARRHGHLVVHPAASCVRSTDPALLREVVAHRGLGTLQPHLVTDEVAVFQQPPAIVVQALRTAGYLPVEADEHGVVDLRRAAGLQGQTRAVAQPDARPLDRLVPARGSSDPGSAPGNDAEDGHQAGPDAALTLAGQLLRATDASNQEGAGTESEEYIDMFAPQLGALERRQLAFAIEHQLPVEITYQTATGGISRRTISDLELVGDHLYAWCHLRDDQRAFNVGRIRQIRPAGGQPR